MEMVIDFPGGAKVDAHLGSFTVSTDQSPTGGGEGSAPTLFEVFLASLGTCVGVYILGFCRQRGIPTEGIHIVQRSHSNRVTGLVEKIELEIQIPSSFPKQYVGALIRSAELCKVKRTLEQPPQFEIVTKEVEVV